MGVACFPWKDCERFRFGLLGGCWGWWGIRGGDGADWEGQLECCGTTLPQHEKTCSNNTQHSPCSNTCQFTHRKKNGPFLRQRLLRSAEQAGGSKVLDPLPQKKNVLKISVRLVWWLEGRLNSKQNSKAPWKGIWNVHASIYQGGSHFGTYFRPAAKYPGLPVMDTWPRAYAFAAGLCATQAR